MTASVLSSMKSVMMMGLSDKLAGVLQSKRVEEIESSRHFRELFAALNGFGSSKHLWQQPHNTDVR